MPTFILHGGEASDPTPTNQCFWRLMAQSVPAGGMWLGCYFARLDEIACGKYQTDSGIIHSLAPHSITTVMAKVEDFPTQLARADVLYIAGGKTHGLKNQLSEWPQIAQLLQGVRVIAGSSAGMNILGQKYIARDGSTGQGLGLLPFNMLVHHTAQAFQKAHAENHLPHPTLALHETQFCVITN